MMKKVLVSFSALIIFACISQSASADTQFQQIPVRANISYPSGYTQQQGGYVARSNEDGTVFEITGALPHPVSGESGYLQEAYVIDRVAGTTEFVGYAPDGHSFWNDDANTTPLAISANGRYVLFSSAGYHPLASDGTYLFDRQTHISQRVDSPTDSSFTSYATTMSSNGHYIVFDQYSSAVGNQLVLRDLVANTTQIAVTTPYAIVDVQVSSDGRYTAYVTNGHTYIYDNQIGTATDITQSGEFAFEPSISDDGQLISYTSEDATTHVDRVRVHNMQTGQITDKPIGTHTALLSADGSTLVMHGADGGIIYSNPPDSAGVAVTSGQYDDPYSINSTGTVFTFNQGNWDTDYVVFATLLNNSPAVSSLANATVNEGDTFTQNGSFTDSDSTSWTATVDYGDGSGVQNLALNPDKTFSLNHTYQDNGTYTVTVSVIDDQGAAGSSTATVTVNNVAPTVGVISASINPIQINSSTTLSANFTDPGVLDTHTASWDWGDGTASNGTVAENNGSGSVSDSHIYTTAGVYQVTLTVIDKDSGVGSQMYQYISVYNPTSQGLFSAGQVFTSPTGALVANSNATGKVLFGLSYKYQGTVPTGNRQFSMSFNNASFHFNATTVNSLVIANGLGTLTGTGTINGSGIYNFLVTGSENTDTIRIKITDSSNVVIYDTQMGDADTAIPIIAVTGNVLAH